MSTPTRDDAPSAARRDVPEWTIGDRIRKARREADLSQQQLADAIGVTVRRLGNWEAGYNRPDDVVTVARAVSAATGIRADWLLGIYEAADASGRLNALGGTLTRSNRQGYSRSRIRTRASLFARHPAAVS